MLVKPKIGLLPLYLELYDDRLPEMRKTLDPFLRDVIDRFERSGVEVAPAPVCRLKPEFQEALRLFKAESIDLLVTLHLAYSPSLESAEVLAGADFPILILDTTMDHEFGCGVDPDRILYNHGIHGVQDLASMLRRFGKEFHIIAGHVAESKVMERAVTHARAAAAAASMRNGKVLRIGEPFAGMGDFSVSERVLREAFGIEVDEIGAADLARDVESVSEGEIGAELEADRERFECAAPEDVHRRSLRVGLGLRRYLERGGYRAFSASFLAFDSPEGSVNTVPFLEISKAMSRGTGYAGEGDVLTASLVGALARAFGKTTFTEIFCPDWKGNALFLSHMGEINPDVSAGKPLLYEKEFPFTDALNPAALACGIAPGPATFVNLAPGPHETFDLIAAPVEVLGDGTHPEMRKWIRGWVQPKCELAEFLELYSLHGGTHHSALVLGERMEAVAAFASFLGIECQTI